MSETFRGFVTKYALTKGIEERELTACESAGMVKWRGRYLDQYLHGEGREWHRTREGAVKRAEEMRLRKIESHKRSIRDLEHLRFE